MFDKTIGVRSMNGDNCAFQLHWQSYESKYSTFCMVLTCCVNLNISTSFSRSTSDLHPEEWNGTQSLSQAGLEKMMDVWKGKLACRGQASSHKEIFSWEWEKEITCFFQEETSSMCGNGDTDVKVCVVFSWIKNIFPVCKYSGMGL